MKHCRNPRCREALPTNLKVPFCWSCRFMLTRSLAWGMALGGAIVKILQYLHH